MDSGNSGSLQSSSAGDDEHNSRAAAGFIDGGRVSGSTPQLFDPLYSYLQQNKGLRDQSMMPAAMMSSPCLDNGDDRLKQESAARNTKKRSRAARRAPTTVLTTDTLNFRAMVQEYTGIPPLPGTRYEFLPNKRPCASVTAPPYLRRPFPLKFQPSILPTYENQNPPFSSLLQGNPRFPFSIPPINKAKSVLSPPITSNSQPPKLGFFNDFESPSSLTLQNLLFPDQNKLQNEGNEIQLGDSSRAESMNGGGPYIFFKDDITADFRAQENSPVSADGGGLGSWICSSQLK